MITMMMIVILLSWICLIFVINHMIDFDSEEENKTRLE